MMVAMSTPLLMFGWEAGVPLVEQGNPISFVQAWLQDSPGASDWSLVFIPQLPYAVFATGKMLWLHSLDWEDTAGAARLPLCLWLCRSQTQCPIANRAGDRTRLWRMR